MPHTIIGKILEPLGLYQINNTYLQPINERLDELDDDLQIVENNFESAHHIIHALKKGDYKKAMLIAFDYLDTEEDAGIIAQARIKTMDGSSIDDVLTEIETPALTLEIMNDVKRQLTYSYGSIMELMADSLSLDERISERSLRLPLIAEDWSWSERMGTSEALENTAEKVQQVRARAEQAQERVDCLRDTLERLIH